MSRRMDVERERVEKDKMIERGEICKSCWGKIIHSDEDKKIGEDGYCQSCQIRTRMNLKR